MEKERRKEKKNEMQRGKERGEKRIVGMYVKLVSVHTLEYPSIYALPATRCDMYGFVCISAYLYKNDLLLLTYICLFSLSPSLSISISLNLSQSLSLYLSLSISISIWISISISISISRAEKLACSSPHVY